MRVATVLACAALAAACSSGERRTDSSLARATGDSTADSAVVAEGVRASLLAADSVGITSQGGEVLLSVAHDSVSIALSPERLDQIRRATDTAATGSGIGGVIERRVKSTVQSALAKRIMVPLSEVESVRYEDGAIRFRYRTPQRGMTLESVKIDDRPALESFAEADARLFVSAVQARLRLR